MKFLYKFLLILIILIENISLTHGITEFRNEIKILQSKYDHIEYDYPVLNVHGNGTNEDPFISNPMQISFSIIGKDGKIIDFNDNISLEPIIIGKEFTYSNIPNKIKISHGKGNLTVGVYIIPSEPTFKTKEDSGLLLILRHPNLLGHVLTWANGAKMKNPSDYISSIMPNNILNVPNLVGTDKEKQNNISILLDGKTKKDVLLSFVSNIATPKTISGNPNVIGINGIFAFLYLIIFYFAGALFNSYFQEKGDGFSLNKIILNYWFLFWRRLYEYFLKITGIYHLNKILLLNKLGKFIGKFFIKFGHKFNVIFGFLVLGIIGQIIIGSFNINTADGWLTVGLLMLSVGVLSLLKDLILYLFTKKEESSIKIELIPSGYILLSIIAFFVRITNIIPGILFGSAIKLNTKTSQANKVISNSKLILISLLLAYLVGIMFWFSTLFFEKDSFGYNFLLANYFSIANDTFFTLLPFGLFWGVQILKDKILKPYWLVFIFVSIFTLFHTIFNPKGDFNQVLKLQQSSMKPFIFILIFWIFTTLTFWYFMFFRTKRKFNYSYVSISASTENSNKKNT